MTNREKRQVCASCPSRRGNQCHGTIIDLGRCPEGKWTSALERGTNVEQPGIIERAASFVSAVTSPNVDDAEFNRRIAACRACKFHKEEAGKEYCTECGCPKWRLSELSTKLRFSRLKCPKGKW